MIKGTYIEHNGITVSFEEITPEMAKTILDETNAKYAADETKDFHNRRPRNGTVKLYSKDMVNEKWVMNGATIVFDKEGRLMDGQHRMLSIIRSNKSQFCLVVKGVDNSAMTTIDSGLKRSLENYLQFQAESYVNGSAAVVKTKYILDKIKMETDQSKGNLNVTNTELVEEYMNNEAIVKEATDFAKGINKAAKPFRVSEVGGIYLHLIYTLGYDKTIVKGFFERLKSVSLGEKSIYKRLYDGLLQNTKNGKLRMELYLKCWNAFVKGTKNFPSTDENSWFLKPKPYFKECA